MTFKFENLEVWKLSLDYLDTVYKISEELPKEELYNLRNQWIRSATSIALNITEVSTGQTFGTSTVSGIRHSVAYRINGLPTHCTAQEVSFRQ
jgi:hypothetical protein